MNIATISGGIMSFYSAFLSIQKYGSENVVLYFNDTKWEHPDLYRFLEDIEKYLGMKILIDSDGRNPEEVFFDQHFLGCDRVPLCSRILKAERLQEYYKDGDNLIFGIGLEEKRRCERIVAAYQVVYTKTGKYCTLEFPLVDLRHSKTLVKEWFWNTGLKLPKMYFFGFEHNNCSGGCVRQGKKQWLHLLETFPDVFSERENLEKRFREKFGKGSFLKGITLEELRRQSNKTDSDTLGECVGICQFIA